MNGQSKPDRQGGDDLPRPDPKAPWRCVGCGERLHSGPCNLPTRDAVEGATTCASCGLTRGKHSINGDAYGVCGKFVENVLPKPAPDECLVSKSDRDDLDEVCRVLGIQDSHVTPVQAVEELNEEIERLRAALSAPVPPADGAGEMLASKLQGAIDFSDKFNGIAKIDVALLTECVIALRALTSATEARRTPTDDEARLLNSALIASGTAVESLQSATGAAEPVAHRRIRDDGVVTYWETPVPGSIPLYATPPVRGDREALIELIMRETTDKIVADGWDVLGKPNVLVQGCKFIRRNTRTDPTEGYTDPQEAAKRFAGFIADAILSLPVQPGAGT